VATAHHDARQHAIEEHMALVHALARRYAGRGEPVEDLVQAGTVGLIKAVDRFEPSRGELQTFAVPFIRGEIRHHLRRRRRDGVPVADVDPGAAAPADGDLRLLVAGGLDALEPTDRRILELRFFEDRTQVEIAGELGLSPATVSRRVQASLRRLRATLGESVEAPTAAAYSAPEMATRTPAPAEGEQATHSGRFLVRMPQTLHADLARAAEREGVSLNTYITATLATAAARGPGEPPTGEDDRAAASPRWTRAVLAANLVVVGLAAIVAIVLLVVAWRHGF